MTHSVFHFDFQSHVLRIELDENGEPLFHANDLCAILGYANPWDALARHVEPCDLVKREVTFEDATGTQRKTQMANFVREPGMWSLLLGSHAPNAKPVKYWLTHDVLPSIRKHGYYVKPGHAFDDVLPDRSDLPPLHRPDSAKLSEYRRISKSLVKVYLYECGVTPEYLSMQLAKIDRHQPAAALSSDSRFNPAPFELLQQEVPIQAEVQDERYYYFRRPAFEKLCGDYDPTDTARMLRDRQLLKYQRNSLTWRAGKGLFGSSRPLVYAIKKSIV
jgi:prophage antirepressor-like protein